MNSFLHSTDEKARARSHTRTKAFDSISVIGQYRVVVANGFEDPGQSHQEHFLPNVLYVCERSSTLLNFYIHLLLP
jgi:hypothetical protein